MTIKISKNGKVTVDFKSDDKVEQTIQKQYPFFIENWVEKLITKHPNIKKKKYDLEWAYDNEKKQYYVDITIDKAKYLLTIIREKIHD